LREEVGADVISEHRKFLMNDFENYNIHTITGAKVSKFYDDGVKIIIYIPLLVQKFLNFMMMVSTIYLQMAQSMI
ncbi:hypothetical protein ACTPD5_22250, partial [Clostridioides difficile]|uniref:hypothetical protein n=1 Tax=Clostridioides difficile TaxID=1496 RepID=UPI003F8D4462